MPFRSPVARRAALLALALGTLGACATSPTPAPAPAPTPTSTTASTTTTSTATTAAPRPAPTPPANTPVPAVSADEPPNDWHLLDLAADGYAGISMRRAERELLAGRQPQRSVLVAVIDGGVDTAHVDLRANLWSNPRETAGSDGDGDGLLG